MVEKYERHVYRDEIRKENPIKIKRKGNFTKKVGWRKLVGESWLENFLRESISTRKKKILKMKKDIYKERNI